jgi:hypothetical protein
MSSRRAVKEGCPNPSALAPRNLADVVRMYRRECGPRTDRELGSFAQEPTVARAVRRAGLAQRPDGKRYDHQRRLSRATLRTMATLLQRAPLSGCRSFHDLYERVAGIIGSVPGVGSLTVYDTALRIGARLRLSPDHVYLHAGTRKGARRLGLDATAEYLRREDLPRELRVLPAQAVEDVLCIFEPHFRSAWFQGPRSRRTRS